MKTGSKRNRLRTRAKLTLNVPPEHNNAAELPIPSDDAAAATAAKRHEPDIYDAADDEGPSAHLRSSTTFVRHLGQGASGSVDLHVCLDTLHLVAIKSVSTVSSQTREMFLRELHEVHENLVPLPEDHHHQEGAEGKADGPGAGGSAAQSPRLLRMGSRHPCPYIVSFYGAYSCRNDARVALCLEFMDGGSLKTIVTGGGVQSETIVEHIAHSMLVALAHMHNRSVCHRDIKPDNVLINHAGEVKLADFGLAVETDSDGRCSDFCGTLAFMSPERLDGDPYGFPGDIWGLGLTLLCVATGSTATEVLDLAGAGGDGAEKKRSPSLRRPTFFEVRDVISTQRLTKMLSRFGQGGRGGRGGRAGAGEGRPESGAGISEESVDGVGGGGGGGGGGDNGGDGSGGRGGGSDDACATEADEGIWQGPGFSPHFVSFLDACLDKDPAARPSAEELLGHPFICDYRPHDRHHDAFRCEWEQWVRRVLGFRSSGREGGERGWGGSRIVCVCMCVSGGGGGKGIKGIGGAEISCVVDT